MRTEHQIIHDSYYTVTLRSSLFFSRLQLSMKPVDSDSEII